MNSIERQYDITFSYYAPFLKAYEEGGDMFVVVKASDTSVDRDGECISPALIEKMKRLAKEGKIVLLESHKSTFPLGVSVGVEEPENDPNAFYPIFKLDREHPLAAYLFKKIKEGGVDFGVSVGGRFPKVRWTLEQKSGRPITEVIDVDIDHVAFTRRGYEANPNTGIVRAIIKELQSVGIWEKEMNLLQQVTRVSLGEAEETEEGKHMVAPQKDDEKSVKGDTVTIAKEAIKAAVEELMKQHRQTLTADEFAAEFHQAMTEARISRPEDEAIFARERQFGYHRGTVACGIKPSVWSDVPDYLFADRVGYLYPMDDKRFEASLNHFLKVGVPNIYLLPTAVKVYENFVRQALKIGYPITYATHPLLSAGLPADLKTQLPDFSPAADITMGETLKQAMASELLTLTATPIVWTQEINDATATAIKEREELYGYPAPLILNAIKPAYLNNISDTAFADPVGYRFPTETPKQTLAGLIYFADPANRNAYTVDGQVKVFSNLVKAALSHGIKVAFDANDALCWLLPPNLKRKLVGYKEYADEDTKEKEAETLTFLKEQEEKMKASLRLLYGSLIKEGEKPEVKEVEVTVVTATGEVPPEADRVAPHEAPKPDVESAKPKVYETDFIIALPVEQYDLSDPSTLNLIAQRIQQVGEPEFNVVRVNATEGSVVIGKEQDIEIFVKEQGVLVRGLGKKVLWALEDALCHAAKRQFGWQNCYVCGLRDDMAVFCMTDDNDETHYYAVGWQIDPVTYEVRLTPSFAEVVETYELLEDALQSIERLRSVIWRPDTTPIA